SLGAWAGIGFVFAESDPYCGIDLDGCRDPITGRIADWAREIVLRLKSYTEVSPSETGVKIWVRGEWRHTSHKVEMKQAEQVCEKAPAVEVYDRLRYFAVTGQRLRGPATIELRQTELDALRDQLWSVSIPQAAKSNF